MYKVVIIDDEPIIVRGLEKTVKWENWECMVAGTAFNGAEGMGLIRRERPDMLISDICMPEMDGLSMIAALKSEFPDMEITILTGCRDFDYAREAIRLGVCRFLLKPSKMDELNEAIEAMIERLKGRAELRREGNAFGKEKVEDGAAGCTGKRAEDGTSTDRTGTDLFAAESTAWEEGEENQDREKGLESAASSFIVKNALAYIEANYKERLKLADVADNVYVSQWHLSKLLNKYTGQTFSELLNHVRMEQAKQLLGNPSLRIGDIAEAVGFLDMAHFSRVFKKQEGISANEYRNTVSVPQKEE